MELLRRAARALAPKTARMAVVAVLALPLFAMLTPSADGNQEQREWAAIPGKPGTWGELLAWPAAADAWINDHFGWRPELVTTYTWLRHDLFGTFPTTQVIAGREGRIFLAGSAQDPELNLAIKWPCGWGFKNHDAVVAQINGFAQRFQARGIDARLLIVPSAPVVYSEQLPPWLAERCSASAAPAYAVLASPALEPAARRVVYFPLAEMRAMREQVQVFPLTFFHWAGSGAQAVVELTQRQFWQRGNDAGTPLSLVAKRRPSDIQWMFPGITLDSLADEPDFSGTTITACLGADCLPDWKPALDKLEAGRYTNSAPGLAPRLVLITDSFGQAAAPFFARYYSEVIHVSTNGLGSIPADALAQLRARLLDRASGDEVLFLYYDGDVYTNRIDFDLALLKP